MLRIIFLFLLIINFCIFIFTNKKINYLFIYFLSSCLYYSNAVIGHYFISSNNHISGTFFDIPICMDTYMIMIINMIIILFFSLFSIKTKSEHKKNFTIYYNKKRMLSEKYAVRTLIIINIIFSVFSLRPVLSSIISQSYDKSQLLDSAGFITSYFKYISCVLLLYIYTQKNIKYSKLDYIGIIFCITITMLLGHRSYIVISMIGIIIYKINETMIGKSMSLFNLIKENKKKLFVLLLLFLVFMISKNIYTSAMNGNYELVLERLANKDYYLNSFKLTEFNTIFSNLEAIVSSNFSFSPVNYVRAVFVFIPFLNRFINIEKFSSVYQMQLFGVSNRASTFIGEAYACGGFLLTIIIIIIVLLVLLIFNNKIYSCKSNVVKTFFIISAIDFSFYIHRNSLEIALTRCRSYLYIIIIIGIFKILYERMIKSEE